MFDFGKPFALLNDDSQLSGQNLSSHPLFSHNVARIAMLPIIPLLLHGGLNIFSYTVVCKVIYPHKHRKPGR